MYKNIYFISLKLKYIKKYMFFVMIADFRFGARHPSIATYPKSSNYDEKYDMGYFDGWQDRGEECML